MASVNNLRQAMRILENDSTPEGTRIREAIAVVQKGEQHDVLRLCTRSAGWDVARREGGKDRPLAKVRADLRQSLLSATRRHLEARGSDESHLAAASRADAEPLSQPTSAKRPLRMAPTTEDARRLTPLRDELATQPPRKKLTELVAHMDVPEMRGDADCRF